MYGPYIRGDRSLMNVVSVHTPFTGVEIYGFVSSKGFINPNFYQFPAFYQHLCDFLSRNFLLPKEAVRAALPTPLDSSRGRASSLVIVRYPAIFGRSVIGIVISLQICALQMLMDRSKEWTSWVIVFCSLKSNSTDKHSIWCMLTGTISPSLRTVIPFLSSINWLKKASCSSRTNIPGRYSCDPHRSNSQCCTLWFLCQEMCAVIDVCDVWLGSHYADILTQLVFSELLSSGTSWFSALFSFPFLCFSPLSFPFLALPCHFFPLLPSPILPILFSSILS